MSQLLLGAGMGQPMVGPFAPTNIPGLKLWWKSDTQLYQESTFATLSTADGNPAGGWRDQSGTANDLSQATAGKRALFKTPILNGFGGIKFDGVDDCLFTNAATGMAGANNQFTMFVVLKTGALGTQCFVNLGGAAGGGGSGKAFRIKDSGGQLELLKANTANLGASTGTLAANTAYVVAFDYLSPNGTFYINGVAAGTISSAQTFANPATDGFVGAQDNVAVTPFPGHVFEVVYYDQQVSAAERDAVHSYLLGRYGLGGPTPSSLLTGLAAYWKLDEVSGTRADSLGVEHLTDNNTVTSVAGKISTAAQFTAANSEYLSHVDDANLSMGPGLRLTIAGWFQFSGGNQGLLGKWEGATSNEYLLFVSGGGASQFLVSSNGSSVAVVGTVTPSLNTWHFVAARYDGTNISVRVDAGAWENVAFAADIFNGTAPFEIGRAAGGLYLGGLVDELGLWKVALTDAQVDSLYNAGSGVSWPFTGVP